MTKNISSILLTLIFIASCGGGGGGGSSSGGGSGGGYGGGSNTAPVLTGVLEYAVPENTTNVSTFQATDAQGDAISYSISGTDSNYFNIGSSSGVLEFNSAPDFESPQDANTDNVYELLVIASDGSLSSSLGITVNVTDVAEGPTITSSNTFTVEENQTSIGEVTTSSSSVTFSLSGDDSALITISSAGLLEFVDAPDYESPQDAGANNIYNITVTASDSAGSVTQNITITVTDVEESNNAADLFISEYAEGTSNNKYLEIFNGTGAEVSLSGYALPSTANAPNVVGEYEYWNDGIFGSATSIADGDVHVICHPSAAQEILDKCDSTHQYLSNGDDGYMLVKGTESSYTVVDTLGDFNGDPGSGWEVCGMENATANHTLVKKDGVEGNADWDASRGTSSENCDWVVKDNEDWTDLGIHTWNGSSSGGGSGGGGGGGGGGGSGGGGSGGGIPSGSTELYISEYADVDSQQGQGQFGNTKYIEIYNPHSEAVDLSAYTLKGIPNSVPDSWGAASTSCSGGNCGRVLNLSGTLASKDVYVITGTDSSTYGDVDDYVVSQADLRLDYESPVHFNGDDAVGLFKGETLLDSVGEEGPADIGVGWDVCGVDNATRAHTLIKKSDKVGTANWTESAGTSSTNCHWIVEDEGDFSNVGYHNQQRMLVTIPNGVSGGLYINGQQKLNLELTKGETYRFDTSNSSNGSHPIKFGDATEASSSAKNYGTQVGTPGTANSYYLLEITDEIPSNFYYFCDVHAGMGSSVSITDTSNNAPVISMPSNVYTQPVNYVYVDEGQTSVTTISATDADNDTLSYFITGVDENSFSMSSSGVISLKNAPDYSVSSQKKEFEIIVNVSDGTAIDSETLHVFVNEVCSDSLIGFNVCLSAESDGGQDYNRDSMYPTWDDWDNDCQSNRQEVLLEETLADVTYTSATNCTVSTGRWYDPYDDRYFTNAVQQVQIDHFVPLFEAHNSGAWRWSSLRKRIFANTLNLPEQLIAVGGASNSAKGSSDPSEWMPDNTNYHCEYLRDWVKVKSTYRLAINVTEKNAIESQYSGCENSN